MKSLPDRGIGDVSTQRQSYTPRFFSETALGSLGSARVMLKWLFEFHQPKSVIDIGCGQGTWLAAAEELGATSLAGLDGPWVEPAALHSSNIRFRALNLESDLALAERFDLCISMEVAEHLAPNAARRFVHNLCAASDVVLFSAAIKHQGGVMHTNEQPQSYWARLFADFGYECHDLFRPVFWNDQSIQAWYRQNTLLYIKPSHPSAVVMRARTPLPGPLDIVHPELYAGNLENYRRAVDQPTLRFCWQALERWGRRQLAKIRRRGNNASSRTVPGFIHSNHDGQ